MIIKYLKSLLLCFLCLNFSSCETEEPKPKPATLSFPVGRVFLNQDELYVYIGEQEYQPNVVNDNSGGYWISIPREDVPNGEKITIRFLRKEQALFNYKEEQGLTASWTEPSYYIDSDNEMITQKAVSLTSYCTSVVDKAERLQQFVSNYMTYNDEKKYLFYQKASQTYLDRKGICVNMSRLYIALCRSVGIPARSVWGVVSGHAHHQWAEIRDEDGYWHATDFGFTRVFDLNDIRYLDLFYGAEENDFFLYHDTTEIMFYYQKYYNNYPVIRCDGFSRVTNNKDGMLVEYTYQPGKLIMN